MLRRDERAGMWEKEDEDEEEEEEKINKQEMIHQVAVTLTLILM